MDVCDVVIWSRTQAGGGGGAMRLRRPRPEASGLRRLLGRLGRGLLVVRGRAGREDVVAQAELGLVLRHELLGRLFDDLGGLGDDDGVLDGLLDLFGRLGRGELLLDDGCGHFDLGLRLEDLLGLFDGLDGLGDLLGLLDLDGLGDLLGLFVGVLVASGSSGRSGFTLSPSTRLMLRLRRRRSESTSMILTLTCWPTDTTSSGRSTWRLASSLMCTRPSMPS